MSDIAARLRDESRAFHTPLDLSITCGKAADEIESLRARLADAEQKADLRRKDISQQARDLDEAEARIAALEEALRPFAKLARLMPDNREDERVWYVYDGENVVVGDLRRAATLLEDAPTEGDAT